MFADNAGVASECNRFCTSSVCWTLLVMLEKRIAEAALQGTSSIHALMQDSDDGDAVTRRPKIDDMLLDTAPPIARPNVGAALRLLWRFRQIGAGGFDKIGVAHSLGQTPMGRGIVEHPVNIALRPGTEPIFSHAVRLCAA